MKKFFLTLAGVALAMPAMFGDDLDGPNMGSMEMYLVKGSETDVVSDPTSATVVDMENMGDRYEAYAYLTPMESFLFYMGQGGTPSMAFGPEEMTLVMFNPEQNLTGTCDNGEDGYWTYFGQEQVFVKFTFSLYDQSYSLAIADPSEVGQESFVTFNFTGVDNAYQYITTASNGTTAPSVDAASIQVKSPFNFYFMINQDYASNYEIESITCTTLSESELEALNVHFMDNGQGYWQCYSMQTTAVDGLVFDVKVVSIGDVNAPITTTINFVNDGVSFGQQSINDYVSISSTTDGMTMTPLDITENPFTFTYEEDTYLVIAPASDEYKIEVSTTSSPTAAVEEMEGEWYVTLNKVEGVSNVSLTVTVSEAPAITPAEPIEVTVNVAGLEGLENPASYIIATYTVDNEETGDVTFANNVFNMIFNPELNIAISLGTEDGYAIGEITTPMETEDIKIVAPANNNIGGDWGVTIFAGAPEVVEFTVTVGTNEVVSGIDSIYGVNGEEVIYNLQGLRVNRENLPAGIYIINGKKAVVK